LEDITGKKEMSDIREQLELENLLDEEEKIPEAIPILPGKFQPRKVEELIPNSDIIPDTYIIYPTGGYHPFYGVLNTLPIYQQKIWPYIKRIKYNEKFKDKEKLNRIRKANLTKNQNISQVSSTLSANNYVIVGLITKGHFTRVGSKCLEQYRKPKLFHRLVSLAWIPNPDNKPYVLHINNDSTNFLISNLKWGTASENNIGTTIRRPDTMEQKYLNLVNKGTIKG
jgi:hypothetical protein|tara:strand:- start:18 stop:695 length:678 start_codon:yes stop_codon:yes gene_type:complete